MENKWKTISFDQICDITRGASPRPIQEHLVDNGTPWVKIADATKSPSRYITDTKEFIKPESEKNSRIVYPGELIVSNSATPALPRFLKIRACVHDGWLILRNLRNVCPEFLYYKIEKEREALLMKGNGAIFTNLKTEILKEHEIQLPPLPEQKAIASVLSSLDDKIDLLHQQNQTLEALAETLFRQWFIEEAKEDWEEGKLEDLVLSANTGLDAIRRAPIVENYTGIKCLRIQDISQNKTFDNWGNTEVKDSDFVKAQLKRGDIIMARTCSPGILLHVQEDLNAVFNNGLARIRANENSHPIFLKYLFKTNEFINHIYGISDGTAVQLNMKLGDLLSYDLKIPPIGFIDKFVKIVSEWDDKILSNQQQVQTLTQLRDTLLPKLMSGEVRVKV